MIGSEESVADEHAPPSGSDVTNRLPRPKTVWLLAGFAAAIVLVYAGTSLSEVTSVDRVQAILQGVRDAAWTPVLVFAVYAALGLAFFPITVLIAATGAVFGPVWGALYGLAGSFIAALTGYTVGAALGRQFLRRRTHSLSHRFSQRIGDNGLVFVCLLRIAPLAPFTAINLLSGASHVRLGDYAIGTLMGMAPGIAVMSLFGSALTNLAQNPSPQHLAIAIVSGLAWFALSIQLQKILGRLRQRADRR